PKPGADSFLNHRTLKLSKHAHHLKHCLAGWRAGVEALCFQEQVDASGVELAQESYQVLQTAAEAIDRPSHKHIKLTPSGSPTHCVVGRLLVPPLGAANAVVLVDLHDFPPGALGDFSQLTLLISRCLIHGAHPQIHDGAFHGKPPLFEGVILIQVVCKNSSFFTQQWVLQNCRFYWSLYFCFSMGFSVRSRHCADGEAMCARAWCGAATGFRFSALLANESYYFRGGHAREISAT